MTPRLRKLLFETLYKNRYLYRFASTVPFAGQWRIWQRQVLPCLQGHDVLELGCGLGDLLADMLAAGYDCRAVEHSPAMVSAARDTLRKRKVGASTHVLQGSAQSLPFSDATFDNVVSTFPSEYIYDKDTISEIKRVLRPGGRVIIIEGANLHPVGYIQPFLIFIHFLVYGPGTLFGSRKRRKLDAEVAPSRQRVQSEEHIRFANRDTVTGVTTEELSNARFGRLIPLERFGFRRRSQRVYSRRWEVYITIGEKPVTKG
jgi:ubiquinone/menaquinone biosynthesis C-methylase UbiE